MHFFDPQRQHDNAPNGQRLSNGDLIPVLSIEPELADNVPIWRIGVMVRTSHKGHSYRFTHAANLDTFAERWLDNPEHVLLADFGYDVNQTFEKPAGAPAPALPDASIFG